MLKPADAGAYWNDGAAPYLHPGLNDREALLYAYAAERGVGDNLSYSGSVSTGQILQGYSGTAGSPDTALNPLVKLNRTINLLAANVTGDGAEQASAGVDEITGVSTNQVQAVGRAGIAVNTGTTKGATGSPDACGLYGVGRVLSSGVGVGIGAFLRGESASASGSVSTLQLQAYNNRGADDTVFSGGFPSSSALYMWADGPYRSSQAITIDNVAGRQFDAGIVFSGQVNGGLTGGVRTADIQSNSTATTSLLINGARSGTAIAIAASAGGITVGELSPGFASALIEVLAPNSAADPAVCYRAASGTAPFSILSQNGTNGIKTFVAGGTNDFMTGTAQGDVGVSTNSGTYTLHLGVLSTAAAIKINGTGLGFYGHAPAAQPSAYTVTNATTSRSLNETGATLVQLANVVGTLIADLQSVGLLQ